MKSHLIRIPLAEWLQKKPLEWERGNHEMIYILNDILANAHFAMSFNKENTLGFAKWSN